jgi:predicted  nucleic acid-binding Zn-ribbon protein
MARKPTDIVQPNLRIRESLRRQLEREAKKHGVSLNQEMTHRLMRSFEEDAKRTIDIIASDLAAIHDRVSKANHKANMLGDLTRDTETLLRQIDAGNSEAIKKAAEKVRSTIRMVDAEAALAIRQAHTTGELEQ